MKNFRDNKTGKEIFIPLFKTKIVNGKPIYLDLKGKVLDVTKIETELTIPANRTETKNR